MERLRKLTRNGKAVSWNRVELDPGRVTNALEDLELDVVYLYCHARGGAGGPAMVDPYFEFSDKVRLAKLTDDQFDF